MIELAPGLAMETSLERDNFDMDFGRDSALVARWVADEAAAAQLQRDQLIPRTLAIRSAAEAWLARVARRGLTMQLLLVELATFIYWMEPGDAFWRLGIEGLGHHLRPETLHASVKHPSEIETECPAHVDIQMRRRDLAAELRASWGLTAESTSWR